MYVPKDHVAGIATEQKKIKHQFGRCAFAKKKPIKKDGRETGEYRLEECGTCPACRLRQHSATTGQCLAECLTSGATLALTLGYEDIQDEYGSKVPPAGAVRHNKKHLKDFKDAFRKKYPSTFMSCSEYGGKHGRAHFHVIINFQWPDALKERYLEDLVYDGCETYGERLSTWDGLLPPHVLQDFSTPLGYGAFRKVLDDPETLFMYRSERKKTGTKPYGNVWNMWKHGRVVAELVRTPEQHDTMAVNRTIRYILAYITKDPWRDSKEFSRTPFDKLPDHIKETTRFGHLETRPNGSVKYHRPNKWREEREAALLVQYPSDDAVPLDERLRKNVVNTQVKGGLGKDYLWILGRRAAPFGAAAANRLFSVTGVYRKASDKELKRRGAGKAYDPRNPYSDAEKLEKFSMKETGWLTFGEGFNYELRKMGKPEWDGPDGQWERLAERRLERALVAKDPFLFHFYRKLNVHQRREFEKRMSYLVTSDRPLVLPAYWQKLLEDHSTLGRWPEIRAGKAKKRIQIGREGNVEKSMWILKNTQLHFTDQGKVVYQKNLTKDKDWWRREVVTVENLKAALFGKLLPEGARGERMAQEGQGDLRRLSELTAKEVQRLISAFKIERKDYFRNQHKKRPDGLGSNAVDT